MKIPFELCSRCTINEIANWIFENQLKLNSETTKQIREELKDIKLKSGHCLVCNHSQVSEGCFERILSILEKSKENSQITSDFRKFCGLVSELEINL